MEPLPDRHRFRQCHSCGAMTPLETRWCVECGMPDQPTVAEQHEKQEERRFAEAFFGRATRATFTVLLANIGLFAALAWLSQTVLLPNEEYVVALVNFGGAVKPFIADGEYWRLVTSMFLHIGLIHVALNGYALHVVGQQVEKLYGAARFVVIYFLTGLAGSAASYLAPTHGGPSAGASGAIFGLFGALFVFGIRHRKELPGVFGRAFGFQVLPTIAINLLITFAVPFIDKGAHIGGLVAGMILAAVMPFARPGERRASVVWRLAAAVCVAIVAVCFVNAYRAPKHTLADLEVPGILVDESDRTRELADRGAKRSTRHR
jgi:rhomboid protease GluP